MCMECRSSVCSPGCPNAVQRGVYLCGCCGEDIYEGEEYVEAENEYYHKQCLKDDMSGLEVAEIFGCFSRIAEREEADYE